MVLAPDGTSQKSLGLSLRNIYETFAICFPTVVDAVRGRVTKQICDDRLDRWSRNIVRNLGIDLTVEGREHMGAGETYLVMSNHQSHYDIPVLFHVVGPNIRMVAKQELFRVPVFGRALAEGGFISIDRGRSPRGHPQPRGRARPARQRHPRVDRARGDAQPNGAAPAVQEGRVLPRARGRAPDLAGDPAGDTRRARAPRECARLSGRGSTCRFTRSSTPRRTPPGARAAGTS